MNLSDLDDRLEEKLNIGRFFDRLRQIAGRRVEL